MFNSDLKKRNIEVQNAKIYFHKTHEIVQIVKNKCDLIITMNVTYSLAKALCDPQKTVLYFVSCSKDPRNLCKDRYFIATSHMKIYRTDEKVFFSSANLSLSSWLEITVETQRTKEIDKFVEGIVRELKLRDDYIAAFH